MEDALTSSSEIILSLFSPNCLSIIVGWSWTKFVCFELIGNPRWP